jgi:hypothetical protein
MKKTRHSAPAPLYHELIIIDTTTSLLFALLCVSTELLILQTSFEIILAISKGGDAKL